MRFLICCVAALAVAASAPLGAQALSSGGPLTLAEAQRRAVERSRQVAAQDFSVAASREMAAAAGQLPDPALKLGVDNLPVNGPDQFSLTRDFMTMRRIGVMQEFTRSDKRELRAKRFENEAEKTLAEKAASVAAIRRDTALAWLDRYYAEAMAAVLAEQAGEVKLEITAAEGAYRGGRGTRADVIGAHGALAGLEDRASELSGRIRAAKTNLARWMGDGADAPLAGKPAINSVRLDASSLETELAHQPQIVAFSKEEQIASTEANLAQASKDSDWTVEVAYSQRGPSFSNMVSIGVSIPLQWDQKNRQDREIAAKLAMAEQARAQREEALRARVGEVRAMITEWQSGRERLVRYSNELVPLARERTQAALTAYFGGKSSLTDLLLARRNEIDVRLMAVQLESETARLWAQLNFLFPENDPAKEAK